MSMKSPATNRIITALVLLAGASLAQGGIVAVGDVSPANPAGWTTSTSPFIGDSGSGTLTINDGSTVVNHTGNIAYRPDSVGVVAVDGADSKWTNAALWVADRGEGTLNITNGGEVVATYESGIGYTTGSIGKITVADASSTFTTKNITVGNQGKGTLEITNGGEVVNTGYGYIGGSASGEGLVTVAGANSKWTLDSGVRVGRYCEGTLEISNGGAVSNTWAQIGDQSGSVGTVTVEGNNSTWTISSALLIGNAGTAALSITNGGSVSVTGATMQNSASLLMIEVGGDDVFSTNDFTANGTVRLAAQAGLAAGTYAPIANGGTWTDSAATYETLGGVWNATAHTFIVSAAAQATSGVQTTIDLATTQRIDVGGNLAVNFMAAGSSTSLDFTATATSGQTLTDLQDLMSDGQVVQGSWDFDIPGLPGGDDVMLSFALAGVTGDDEVTIWHYDDTAGWTLYDATDLVIADGRASFSVDSFSSYAVTAVPEPATMALLTLGSLAMLRRRRRK